MLVHNSLSPPQLMRPEAEIPHKAQRIEPELRGLIFAVDVNVWWFIRLVAVEVKRVWTGPQNCGHRTQCRLVRCPRQAQPRLGGYHRRTNRLRDRLQPKHCRAAAMALPG